MKKNFNCIKIDELKIICYENKSFETIIFFFYFLLILPSIIE